MVKAIQFRTTGGPEVLKWEDVEVGKPKSGQVRITHRAVGLNFLDCYFRSGLYPMPSKPCGVGVEGSGVVAEGRLSPDGTFIADNLLAKHDENYMPRELEGMSEGQAAEMAEETTVGLQ